MDKTDLRDFARDLSEWVASGTFSAGPEERRIMRELDDSDYMVDIVLYRAESYEKGRMRVIDNW